MTAKNRLIERIKQANRPPQPSDSVAARVLIAISLITTNFAAAQVSEISSATFYTTTLLSVSALVFSYCTRHKPWKHIKILIAISVLVIFFIFLIEILHDIDKANLASVEPPLAMLFIWIQTLHSLDTPARRDLLFSIAASTALLAIAAAQGISTPFLIYIVIWFIASVTALESLQTTSDNMHRYALHPTLPESRKIPNSTKFYDLRPQAPGPIEKTSNPNKTRDALQDKLTYILFSIILAFSVVLFLPPASTAPSIKLPSSIINKIGLANSGSLYQGRNGSEPSKPGSTNSPIRIGGYNGFSNYLDTAIRGSLSNNIVMHVRATDPGYFLSMTYTTWNGTTWSNSHTSAKIIVLNGGSPFYINSGALSGQPLLAASNTTQAPSNVQTFYIEEPMTNVILGTSQPSSVWFPSSKLYLDSSDSSIRTNVAITPGTVYTVVSSDTEMSGNVLAKDNYSLKKLSTAIRTALREYTELPRPYKRVKQLTLAITKNKKSVYAKVTALEDWMSTHVHYSLNIPPLLPGQDTVNQFLFYDRVGYCEQISTALAVMLRSIGIPAREAVGYVPGNFNPLTDLYDVRQNDAHAWVQVWFPKYGWQNFDPTANVPLATPNPGQLILSYFFHTTKKIFWPIGVLVLLVASIIGSVLLLVKRRTMPIVLRFVALTSVAGKSINIIRQPWESPGTYYLRLKKHLNSFEENKIAICQEQNREHLRSQGDMIKYILDTYFYADRDLDESAKSEIKKELKRLKITRQRLRYKKYLKKYATLRLP